MLDCRRALSPEERASAGFSIQQSFVGSPEFCRSQVIALYAPVHGEVDTVFVLQAALKSNKIVLYPTVKGSALMFSKVADIASLRKGKFGISEPCGSCEPVSPGEIDLFVIPGAAFDCLGRRIGYGKGYYDRTLHPFEGMGRFVGFCYDFQLLNEIVAEPHDVLLDMVVTEKRVIRPRG